MVATTSTDQSRSSLASNESRAASPGQGIGAGDVEPGIEAAPGRPGLLDEPIAGLPVGQVGHQDLRTPALPAYQVRDLLGRRARMTGRARARRPRRRPARGRPPGRSPTSSPARPPDTPSSSNGFTPSSLATTRRGWSGPGRVGSRRFVLVSIHVIAEPPGVDKPRRPHGDRPPANPSDPSGRLQTALVDRRA